MIMVYTGTSSGMNTSIWDPHFALTMVGSSLHSVEKGTFMLDWYIGDILLNFIFSEESRPFFVVNGRIYV